MDEGYIYILVNRSYTGLIKIGSTTFGATLRAKQLSSSTAVPTPFTVAYEAYVSHYEELEKAIHDKLSQFRVSSKREFFKVQLDFAIEQISIMKESQYYRPTDHYESIEILPQLITKYGDNVDHQIVSARIYQEIDRVYLETNMNILGLI
jgi:T5orf172 domain.